MRHPSFDRLTQIAVDHGINGPSALALALGRTEQVVTNWARRGVSKAGAMLAQEKFGCSSVWILKGRGPEIAPDVFTAPSEPGAYSGAYLIRLLGSIPADKRQEAYFAATQVLISYLPESGL